jgi:hypothetical protein
VIELEASGWGTTVRASAETETFAAPAGSAEAGLERKLVELLDDLGSSSLTGG